MNPGLYRCLHHFVYHLASDFHSPQSIEQLQSWSAHCLASLSHCLTVSCSLFPCLSLTLSSSLSQPHYLILTISAAALPTCLSSCTRCQAQRVHTVSDLSVKPQSVPVCLRLSLLFQVVGCRYIPQQGELSEPLRFVSAAAQTGARACKEVLE